MKPNLFSFVLFFALTSFIFSCEKKKTERIVNIDSLSNKLTILEDSLNKSWKQMIAADDEKITDIKLWISKIDKIKKQPVKTIDTLNEMAIKLGQIKYSEADISIKAVDKNDSLSSLIMEKLLKIKENVKDLSKHPEEETLFNKIQKADNNVVMDRIKYQGYVLEYNKIVKEYGKELKEKRENFKNLKYKKGFQADSLQGI